MEKSYEKKERKKVAENTAYCLMFIWLIIAFLVCRYAYLQLVEGERYSKWVRYQTGENLVRQSPRGAIYDRNGRELAVSVMTKSLFIDPNSVVDAHDVAKKLSPLINVSEEEILKDIAQGGGFVWVKHHLSMEEVSRVENLIYEEEYNCLNFVDEPKRYYPNDIFAANVLGFVGTDDIGLDGIEQSYDTLIKGGQVEGYVQTDMQDRPIFESIFSLRKYQGDKCKSIELTIDSTVQFIVEQALDDVVKANDPAAVTAIVMNPKSGEILAMGSRPSYNPNNFSDYPQASWKNRAVAVIYEPGSTFKAIVAAAALSEQIVTPNQIFYDAGFIEVSERKIQNWDGESHGYITFSDIVKNSLNTGFAQVGLELGGKRLTEYAERFGFGSVSNIELPGDEAGILFEPSEMRDSDVATMSIGQSIAVTPIQLLTAVSAIANDGVLLRPYIVKTVRNADGTEYETTGPKVVRRVIDSVIAKTLTGLLEQVVESGGGQKAAVKGYRIAGKTGTAEKIKEGGIGYLEDRYIASFAGFAPVENPQISLLVIIDDPKGAYYGGQIAAPIAARIFEQLFRYLHIEPSDIK